MPQAQGGGEEAAESDFLVVQPLPKPAKPAADGDGDGDGDSDEDGKKKAEKAEGEDAAEEAEEEDAVLPFDPSTFAADLQQVLEGEDVTGLAALARFGIYHKSALVVAVSNLVQEVGDLSAAMAALRARVDHPDAVTSVVPTDDEDEAEPVGGAVGGPVFDDLDDELADYEDEEDDY